MMAFILNFDGRIQINSVVLSGEAQPKTDKDGNEIDGQYSLNGYDLVRSGNDLVITKAGAITNLNRLSGEGLNMAIDSTENKITIKQIKQTVRKILSTFICSIFFFLLFGEIAFSAKDESRMSIDELRSKYPSSLISQQNRDDPDIRLSINELRKKYPIDLLYKKDKTNLSDEMFGYSIDQIKSIFLNADKNFIKRITNNDSDPDNIEVKNNSELKLINNVCDFFAKKFSAKLPNNQERLRLFIFSDKIMTHFYQFLPSKTQECFFMNNPYEDRN